MTDIAARYQTVKQHILDRIGSGDWPPGARIPSENELVAELGISRMTINRAVRELAQEGRVVRLGGVGSFVAEPQSAARDDRHSAHRPMDRGPRPRPSLAGRRIRALRGPARTRPTLRPPRRHPPRLRAHPPCRERPACPARGAPHQSGCRAVLCGNRASRRHARARAPRGYDTHDSGSGSTKQADGGASGHESPGILSFDHETRRKRRNCRLDRPAFSSRKPLSAGKLGNPVSGCRACRA